MMAKIEIEIQANEEEKLLGFEQDSITIGRGLGNDILIEDPQVSRYHARLVLEDGALVLYDLRSRNGTKVNSEKISSCPIRGSEAIMIGGAVLKVKVTADDAVVSGAKKDEYRPTKHHYVSSVFETDEDGNPVETPIYEAEKSTIDLENEVVDPAALVEASRQRIVEASTEKDTESALMDEPATDEPWRPFENCLASVMPFINDPSVENITIASTETAVIKKDGVLERVPIRLSEGQLQEALRIVSASVKPSHSSQASAPAFSIKLADGSELAGAGPALSPPYGVIVISTPPRASYNIQDFIKQKVLSQDMFYFLHGCVALRKSILVSGQKESLSQDLLGVIASCIPATQRITLVKGFSKVEIPQAEVVTFARGMSLSSAVLEAASRTRPDRFVVAESLKGDVIRTFVEQVLAGANGSLGQICSPSPAATVSQLETAICKSDGRLPYQAVRSLVRESIKIVVQLYELPNGTPRVLSISEIVTNPDGSTGTRDIFALKQNISAITAPQYEASTPSFIKELELTGLEEAYSAFKK